MSTHQFRDPPNDTRSHNSHCITVGGLRIYCQHTNLGPYTVSSGLIFIKSEVFEIFETFKTFFRFTKTFNFFVQMKSTAWRLHSWSSDDCKRIIGSTSNPIPPSLHSHTSNQVSSGRDSDHRIIGSDVVSSGRERR